MAKRVAELMVEVLSGAGVKRVYGVSGDSLNGFTDAIRSQKQLQWIHVRHEEVAAAARVILRQARFAACQGDETSFVSHLSAHFWDAPERERRESQGRTGTAAPCKSESHDRRLHAGSRSTEARGAEQSGKAGAEGRGFGDQTGLSGSNWITKESGGGVEVFYFVGVPDGI